MRKHTRRLPSVCVLLALLLALLAAANVRAPRTTGDATPVIGLVISPTEDDWQDTVYAAVRASLKEDGYEVFEMTCSRGQEAQIGALRALIVYRVDAIAFCPVVESGWDNVLSEAARQGVPLVTFGKALKTKSDARLAAVHYDYYTEACRGGALVASAADDGMVAELYGTVGCSICKEMTRGTREALDAQGLTIGYSVCGDFMRSRGKEIVESLLKNGYPLAAIISQNDAMTLGAVDALREADMQPGALPILSFGGGRMALALYEEGWIHTLVQCDPTSLGRAVCDAVRALTASDGAPPDAYFAHTSLFYGGDAE